MLRCVLIRSSQSTLILAVLLGAGLVAGAALAALAEESATAPATAPATSRPAAKDAKAPVTKPAERAEGKVAENKQMSAEPTTAPREAPQGEAPQEKRDILFQFDGISYNDVVRRFAQMADKPLIAEAKIDGELTFFDSQPYVYAEALDTLNVVLSTKGYRLIETGRYLRLVKLDKVSEIPIRTLSGLPQPGEARPGEIVTVVLPLKYLDAGQAKKAVGRMISPKIGHIDSLGEGKGLLITDRLENIRRIRRFLEVLDTDTLVEKEFRTYTLKRAAVRSVADTLNKLLGPEGSKRMTYDSKRKKYVSGPAEPGQVVTVMSDERTNMLMLIGTSDRLTMAAELIEKLDTEATGEGGVLRIFEVKNARVEDLARIIRDALPAKQVGYDKKRKRPIMEQKAKIVPDPATNRLIVSAPVDQMASVERLLRALDKTVTDVGGTRIFGLKNADPQQLAGVIGEAVAKLDAKGRRQKSLLVAADARTRSLIISGSPADIQIAASLIEKLDTQAPQPTDELRIFELKNARAEEIAGTIREALPGKQVGYDSRRKRPIIEKRAKITPDRVTNRLIVSAPADEMADVEKLLGVLDRAGVSAGETRIFPLKVADAQQLTDVIANAVVTVDERGRAKKSLAVTADARTNSLIVTGPAGDIQAAARLIEQLDRKFDGQKREIHVVHLEAGDARKLADSLLRILSQAASRRRRGRQGAASGLLIEADQSTNSLLIACAPEEWPEIESILEQLKVSADTASAPCMRLFSLKHAKADELAGMLREVFDGRRRGRPAQGTAPIVISPSQRTNSLLISAAADELATVAALVESLDVPSAEQAEPVRIIRLASADARQLAETLRAMLPPTPRGEGPKVFLRADALTNSVLIRAPEAERKMLEEMIAKLDRATQAEARETRLIRLEHASAAAVTATLNQLYQGAGGRRQRGGGRQGEEAQRVVVAPAPGNRTLIVDAPRKKAEEIAQLVSVLDGEQGPVRLQIRTYRLTSADARELARSLVNLFAEQRKGRGQAADGKVRPRFEAETASNQLIVAAVEEDFPEIEKVIEKVETSSTPVSQTKMFHLQHAAAVEIVKLLESLLAGQADRRHLRPGPRDEGGLRIAALASSNAVVVKGPPGKLALAEEIIKAFDAPEASAKLAIEIVRLKNGEAESLAKAVRQTLGAQRPRRRPGEGEPRQGQVTVTAEPNSNTILVRGQVSEVPGVVKMIRALDADSTIAAVQVRIYPLANSEAAELAGSISTLFGDMIRHQSRGRRGAPATPFSVVADERTNSLVVSTTSAHFAIVEQLLENLDKAPERAGMDVQYVWLENANATEVAYKINQVFADRRAGDRPFIEADYFSNNALTVIAKEADIKTIESLIRKLDETTKDSSVHIRVIPLTGSKAERMAEVLKRLYGQISKSPIVITDRLPAQQGGTEEVAPAPEVDDEPPQTDSQAEPNTPGKRPAGASVSDEGMFNPKTPPPVTIAVDKQANALIISATRRELDNIELLIAQLTMGEVEGEPEIRIIPVKHADPLSLAKILNDLFNPKKPAARKPKPKKEKDQKPQRPVPPPPPTPVKQKIIVVADLRTRALIIRARPSDFELIEPLVAKLDMGSTVASELRVFPLKNTDAVEVARNLKDIFRLSAGPVPTAPVKKGKKDKDKKEKKPTPQQQRARTVRQMIEVPTKEGTTQVDVATMVTITANRQTNSVVVVAPAEAMELIVRIIQELDQSAAASAASVRMYPLKYAEVASTVEALQQIFPAAPQGKRPAKGPALAEPIRIAGDEAGGLVIVSAPAEEHQRIAQVIRDIDEAQAAQPTATGVYVIALVHGDAAEVAETIRDFYKQQLQAAKRDKRRIEPLAVSADTRANAIVLSTTKRMYEQASQWINQLELMKPTRGPTRIITLEHADPEEVEKAIQQLFSGGSSSRKPGNPHPSKGARGGKVETSVLTKQRAILISASDEDFEAIQALAKVLDEAAAGVKRQVRVFKLTNATNIRVATALNDMYRQAARAGRPEDKVSITALPQTTAVVVTATEEKMQEVAHLIAQLDAVDVAPQLEFRIYPLTHAMPKRIMPMLERMLKQVQQIRPGEPITVEADERTRSIIITARGTIFDQVDKIIETLDKPPAHAATEVLIVPLKRADATNLARVLNEMLRPSATDQVTSEARALQEQVRRLRIRCAMADEIPELDLTKPIKIQADPAEKGSNALMITSTPDNLKAMQAIVEIMDTVPISEGVKVRLLHLASADAQSVMVILREIFQQGQKLSGKAGTTVAGRAVPESISGKALVHQLNVSADVRTNTLLLSGLAESLALAELIVKDLDRTDGKVVTEVRVFRLRHASAERLLPVLQAVFAEGAAVPEAEGLQTHVSRLRTILNEKAQQTTALAKTRAALTIQADPSTNMLVVAARGDVMPLIADVIATMDIPGAGSLNTVRIFPLKNADAARIQQVISDLHAGPNAQLIRDEDKPTLAIDTRTNSLIISSSQKTFTMIEVLLKHLDAHQPIDLRDIRLIPLSSADAASLAGTLQKMMDARVQRQEALGVKDAEALRVIVLPDERSNSLIVGGSPESYQLIKSIAEQLDGAGTALGGRIQIFTLTHANAGTLSLTLINFFNQRYQAARTPDLQRQKPIIVPDLRINSLLVAANQDDTAMLKSLLGKLDVELKDPAVRLVVIPLKHNDAGVVGPMIRNLFNARLSSMTPPGQTPAPQDRVDVVTDVLSNALVISASRENLELIRGLLEKVDVEPPTETGLVRMYPLVNCDALRIATMLEGLFGKGLYKPGLAAAGASAALAAREKVAIAVDVRTNVLIVSASKENFAVIDEIIERIDATEDFGLLGDVRVYALEEADATVLAATLQRFFDQKRQAEQQTGAAGRSLPVSIIPDARTNTLLVAGGRESFSAVDSMIEQLDTDAVDEITEIRVFTLEYADATELAKILTDALNQKPTAISGESPQREAILRFITRSEDGRELITSALHRGVLVTAAPRTNSLVVSAQLQFMPLLESLVEALDSTSPRMAEIRVFTLQNADARRMAEVLTELFRLRQTGGEMRSVNYRLVTTQPADRDGASATLGSAQQHALSITVDARTNSVLVGGTKQYVGLCSDIITKLDSSPAQERIVKVYRLRNARAGDIETALRSFLDQERQRLLATLGDDAVGAAQRLLEREVAVVSVAAEGEAANANTLLLSASPRYFETIAEMIRELDQPPPQVLIQVLLVEISLDDTLDFGMDWDVRLSPGGTSINVGTDFGIATDIGKSGFNLAISSSDLGFFLRALQAQGRLEVLSRPQILASDNQQASIEIGESVPFIRDSRITEQGTTLNTIQYEPVGILLTVTPRINPDGFVRMEVIPEISSLSESTVQISEGLNASIINKRTARTTVSVQDGHTVIIGGLIRTQDQRRVDKVPFLGDLPGIGWLFKKVKIVKERKELLIILTPHVLRNIAEADAETGRQLRGLEQLGEMAADDVLKEKALQPVTEWQRRHRLGDKPQPTTQPAPRPLELLEKLNKEPASRQTPEKD